MLTLLYFPGFESKMQHRAFAGTDTAIRTHVFRINAPFPTFVNLKCFLPNTNMCQITSCDQMFVYNCYYTGELNIKTTFMWFDQVNK